MTTRRLRGMSSERFCRLCCRAPRIRRASMGAVILNGSPAVGPSRPRSAFRSIRAHLSCTMSRQPKGLKKYVWSPEGALAPRDRASRVRAPSLPSRDCSWSRQRQGQIAFRAAGSAGSPRARSTLAVPVPAGTAAGDFLLATIGVRPNTATITPPAGWTLLIRTNQTTVVGSSQAIYYRLAVAAGTGDLHLELQRLDRLRGRHHRVSRASIRRPPSTSSAGRRLPRASRTRRRA